ncbi:MAG: hypothetical protein ACKO3W_08430, partial [bacterium]
MTTSCDPSGWNLRATYVALPEAFWEQAAPARFPTPELVAWNAPLVEELGLALATDGQERRAHLALFATGSWLPPGAIPIAQAYAGH